MVRRGRGEGSVIQRHDHPSCPPAEKVAVDGKTRWVRPKHRCRGKWMAQLGPKRDRRTVYAATKAEVLEKLKELHRTRPITGSAKGWTVEQWMEHWLVEIAPGHAKKASTRRGYRSKINTYIVPLIGHHRLAKLEPRHVRRMYNRLREKCPSPTAVCRHKPRHKGNCPTPDMVCKHKPTHGHEEATIRQTHAIVRRALKIARREGHVDRNVAELIDPPGTKQNKRTPLTLEQARAVLTACAGDPNELRYYLRLYYGLRQGEILGLTWPWVDRDHWDAFWVEETLQPDEDGSLILGDPKSPAGKRPLPLLTVVASRFKIAWARHLAEVEHVTPGACQHLVFTNALGNPVDNKQDWTEWRDMLVKAGVPHTAPHAARNTTVNLLYAAGVSPALVKEIIGHSTVLLSQDTYFVGDLEMKRQALERVQILEITDGDQDAVGP